MCNPMGYDRPPPAFYIHVWPEAPYFIIFFFAFSRRNLFGTFEIPLLGPCLFIVVSDHMT